MRKALAGSIREPAMRINMMRLYASMVKSARNTELILSGRFAGITEEDAGGNYDIKGRMVRLSRWLEELQIGSTERNFENSFLGPIRKAAEFRAYMGRRSPASTDVDGFVFVVSDPYNDGIAKEEMCTLTAIVPCLQSAMYIRVRDTGIAPGWKTFRNVQPMPLTNRLYPTRLDMAVSERRLDMAGMGFLKCPLSEVEGFERSLAMENFCEIGSGQTEKKPRLGAPVMVSGRVTGINPYRITVSGCGLSGSQMTASLSSDLGNGFTRNRLGELKNTWARMLVVVWYWSDGDSDDERPLPELHMIEKTTEECTVVDDIVGLVRIFGHAKTEDLERIYGRVPKHLPLEQGGDGIFLPSCNNGSGDEVSREFVNTVDAIRAMRLEAGSPNIHCAPDEVLDEGITEKYVLDRLKKNPDMQLVLLRIILGEERGGGSTKKEIRKSLPHVTDRAFSYCLWLLKIRFVLEEGGILRATGPGKRHAYEAGVARSVAPELKPAVFLPDLRDTEIPVSFVMRYLGENSYLPISVGGHPCKIAWLRPDASTEEADACAAKVEGMRENVLDVFDSHYHPITAWGISDELGADGLNVPTAYVDALLIMIEKSGGVYRVGDSWGVSTEKKIRRTIARNAMGISKDGIMRMPFIAGKDKDETDGILETLRNDGTVSVLPNGDWIDRKNLEQWQRRTRGTTARDFAVSLLAGRRGGMDETAFMDRLHYRICETVSMFTRREQSESAAKQLIDDRVIELHDGMLRLVAHDPAAPD